MDLDEALYLNRSLREALESGDLTQSEAQVAILRYVAKYLSL